MQATNLNGKIFCKLLDQITQLMNFAGQ